MLLRVSVGVPEFSEFQIFPCENLRKMATQYGVKILQNLPVNPGFFEGNMLYRISILVVK